MSDKEVSLSTADSNALREKLGLKKLNEGAEKNRHETVLHDPEKKGPKKSDIAQAEDDSRGKRARDAITKGGSIVDEEGDEDASGWVQKMRAGRGAKMPKVSMPAPEKVEQEDDDDDMEALKRMKVNHNITDIEDGETVELTFADKRILDKDGNLVGEDGIALENAQKRQKYLGERNQAIRGDLSLGNQLSTMTAEERERAEGATALTGKYDDRPREPSGFTLGEAARMGVAERLEVLTKNAESLNNSLKFQSDYLQSSEIKDRKPKKKIKKRKALELGDKEEIVLKEDIKPKKEPEEKVDENSDEEDAWLYEQLSRQRKMNRTAASRSVEERGAASLMETIEKTELKEEQPEETVVPTTTMMDSKDVLTGTTEFCKAVQTAQEKLESRRHESYTGALQFKQQQLQRARRGARASVKKDDDDQEEEDAGATRENLSEDLLDTTTASALAYLRSRNEILHDQDNHRAKESDLKPLEMATKEGEIRLETRDEFGRVMTPKEAFQQMSWVFHGKRPGAKNEMKRLLRLENELKMKATDVEKSLPTMRALRKVQGSESKAHIVLTSGAQT
jgi:U4/U6.U5 tri-snRNP-associated protein 1